MEPILSVIVNFFQSEAYVKTCMDSLMAQSLQEIEIIAVDDGSSDCTPELLQPYANAYDHVKIIVQANNGLAESRRKGLMTAKGQYVTFVDGDDHLAPDIYEKMISCAVREDLDIVQCNIIPCGDEDKWKNIEAARQYPQRIITGTELLGLYLNREVMPALWQRIFRKEMLLAKPFKTTSKVMSDHFNFPEWAVMAQRVRILPDAGYYWLTRKGSLGQPEHKLQAASAKNRFLSGISILGFSGMDEPAYRDGILRYLTSYMTQTACHLRQTDDSDFDMVYALWDTLKEPFHMLEQVRSLGNADLTRFFTLLESDREQWIRYIRFEFLELQADFISSFRYNGDDIFTPQ